MLIPIPVAYNGIGIGVAGLSGVMAGLASALINLPNGFGAMSVMGTCMILFDLGWRVYMAREKPAESRGKSVFDRIAVNTWIGTRTGGQLMYFPVWGLAVGGFIIERFVA
jgi:hypothetical protein